MCKLSVIIVNYNVKYFLEQAIQSAFAASHLIDSEIIVVDNNSADGSVAFIQQRFPSIRVIANTVNVGFAVANNQAIKIAKGEFILLLNPDTIVEEDTFITCLQFLDKHPNAGALGVKMVDGKGVFLPESKRAFPSPEVAFYKAFGLSALFPKSKLFGKYHLGNLSENETHEVDVLAGAFMMIRKKVLDEIGVLDEQFFMYGEDIDLSYRIVKAGYKNYYFAQTRIVHYKGESTKKGSLNYVKIFYQAMKIFARKHYSGTNEGLFIALINVAIYFRASIAIANRYFKKLSMVVLDATLIFSCMLLVKIYWEYYVRYIDGGKYPVEYLLINVPLYACVWITSIYLSGGYDKTTNALKLMRGIFWGTLVISAVYGFMPESLRFSRGMIVAGAALIAFVLLAVRFMIHFLRFKNLQFGQSIQKRIIVIGNSTEANRVYDLLKEMSLNKNMLGFVTTDAPPSNHHLELGSTQHLTQLLEIYKPNEIIFCAKDSTSQQIIEWMVKLGQQIDYKIIADQSLSIVGSNSKNTAGDLYTVDIELKIDLIENKRNKRFIDCLICAALLITLPIQLVIVRNRLGLLQNIFNVFIGQKTWVGYSHQLLPEVVELPKIKLGVLSPMDGFPQKDLPLGTIARMNMLYAKDYKVATDVDLVLRCLPLLGRFKY